MKVLVANRGEIAIRILRACRDLGVPSVAVYSEADREALHVRYADESVCIGPAAADKSYLNIANLLDAAQRTGATAVHPGYGFLSENPDFAQAVEETRLTFVGPRPETIALLGDKLAARRSAREAGLPVLPGPDEPLTKLATKTIAAQVQYPVLVKAAAGGGGRGIRLARTEGELSRVVTAARKEAQAAFGDDTVYLEPLVQPARHIEVQILGDGAGHVLCLGERECSIQRRRQKLIEEAPAPGLSEAARRYIFDASVRLARALNYRSLGTIEFLLDESRSDSPPDCVLARPAYGQFYFIEINPRIQVEHGVTEMVTGLDLVKEQLRLAAGRPLRYAQEYITWRGAAIEARVLAEEPSQGFMPATGTINYLKEPGGPGIRVDSALYAGLTVTSDYDSLLAKVIAWGENRPVAILRLRRALREFQIGGVPTDLEFLFQVVDSSPFIVGNVNTSYLETFQPPPEQDNNIRERDAALAAALLAHRRRGIARSQPSHTSLNGWRMTAWREQM